MGKVIETKVRWMSQFGESKSGWLNLNGEVDDLDEEIAVGVPANVAEAMKEADFSLEEGDSITLREGAKGGYGPNKDLDNWILDQYSPCFEQNDIKINYDGPNKGASSSSGGRSRRGRSSNADSSSSKSSKGSKSPKEDRNGELVFNYENWNKYQATRRDPAIRFQSIFDKAFAIVTQSITFELTYFDVESGSELDIEGIRDNEIYARALELAKQMEKDFIEHVNNLEEEVVLN